MIILLNLTQIRLKIHFIVIVQPKNSLYVISNRSMQDALLEGYVLLNSIKVW